jgi:hypothetical protein
MEGGIDLEERRYEMEQRESEDATPLALKVEEGSRRSEMQQIQLYTSGKVK